MSAWSWVCSLRCSIAALAVTVAACNPGAGVTCSMDRDCPSHFCRADGTCGPATIDAPRGPDASADGPTGACTPNHDGTIERAELPLAAGRRATFRVATGASWSTAGQVSSDGSRRWDLAAMLSGDADQAIALDTPAGAWWQPAFPTASYSAPLTATSDLLGVFAVEASALRLLGVVSPAGGPTKTELHYDPAVEILAIPLTAGATWSSTSTVSGYAQGVLAAYTERYDSRVDQVGTMTTPYGTFPVLRVATDLARTSGVATLLTKRTFAWLAECFGPVANVQSRDFDTSAELAAEAEVRRLAP